MKQQRWEQQLRERLADYGQPVPDDLWEAIESALPAEPAVAPLVQEPAPRPARLVQWRRWLSAAAAVLLLVGGGALLFWRQSDVPGATDGASEPPLTAAVAEVAAETVAETAAPPLQETEHVPSPPSPSPLAQLPSPPMEAQPSVAAEPPAVSDEQPSVSDEQPSVSDEQPSDATLPSAEPPAVEHYEPQRPAVRPTVPPASRHSLSWSAGLYAANLPSETDAAASTVQPVMMSRSYMSDNAADYAAANGARTMYLSDYEDMAEHQRPVTLGLTLRVGVTPRLWLESAVLYSSLRSTFTHHYGRNWTSEEQRLKYVGVPLHVGCDVWKTRRLLVYASAGGTANVCVASEIADGQGRRDFSHDRPQYSLDASLGVEYRPLPLLGVYLQPGGKYYPGNGSRLQNVFKEQPLMLDVQLGVRFSLR